MNPKLKLIAEAAGQDFVDLVKDRQSEILEAWNAAEEEAQIQETKPKFRLSMSVTLDLDADKMETALTFGIRRKVTVFRDIPDQNQKALELEEAAAK